MTAKAAVDTAAVLAAYDFSRYSTITDIGGGRGHLLRAVLQAVPDASGVLFDLPGVIDTVDAPGERFAVHAGDFLTLDVIMLAITGGRERTSAEFDQLLASVGFRATGTLPTPSPLRSVEAVAV